MTIYNQRSKTFVKNAFKKDWFIRESFLKLNILIAYTHNVINWCNKFTILTQFNLFCIWFIILKCLKTHWFKFKYLIILLISAFRNTECNIMVKQCIHWTCDFFNIKYANF